MKLTDALDTLVSLARRAEARGIDAALCQTRRDHQRADEAERALEEHVEALRAALAADDAQRARYGLWPVEVPDTRART